MKTKKKPTIKSTKPRQPEPRKRQINKGMDPMSVALNLFGEVSLTELWTASTDMIGDRQLREIPMAVDPVGYAKHQKEFERAQSALEKTLLPAQRQAFVQYDDANHMSRYWAELAGFYYGCAFTQTIGGSRRP